jgi:hypothetical protein
MFSSGAVAGDSNGFFHPLGDHAQTSFSIDGQPISDQQSKSFSTQVPLDAIQSMELITGAPPAEFGDKTSLIVNAVTKSGLGQKPNGSFLAQWSSFATYSEEATLALGGPKAGNFLAFNALRSGRFLDTPEFTPLHAIGNNGTIFDRFDYQPTGRDALHLNLFTARNWFQIPNTYDQPDQDQRQKVSTFNFAPGYQHTFGAKTVLTLSPFYRIDHVNYYPSGDPFDDTPATIAQKRTLTNWGAKADVSYASGRHNLKVGTQLMQTRLHENFSFGVTDPFFNAVCVDDNGDPQELPTITNPNNCAKAGLSVKPGTPLEPYLEILPEFDTLLIMSVEPGFGGQKFIPEVLSKVGIARRLVDAGELTILVEIDGGINAETIEDAAEAGVDCFVAGSAVYSAEDPAAAIEALRRQAAAASKHLRL